MSKRVYQRSIPLLMISVIGIIMVGDYFIDTPPPVANLVNEFYMWGVVISTIIALYGFVMMVGLSSLIVIKRKKDSRTVTNNVLILIGFCSFMILGLLTPGRELGASFMKIYIPIVAYFGSGFFFCIVVRAHIAGAQYAFSKIRTLGALMFFLAWLFVTIRDTSALVGYFPPFLDIGNWITNVPVKAGYVASFIAMGVATITLALRALIGREHGLIELETESK